MLWVALAFLSLAPAQSRADNFDHQVQLSTSSSGSLYVSATIGGVAAEFLVDTGAGLVTVGERLFASIRRAGKVREVRRVAARLANGRLQAMTVYEVPLLRIGPNCELGPVEIAVAPGGGRNLLGLSALRHAAPFAIHTAPPSLALTGCRVARAEESTVAKGA